MTILLKNKGSRQRIIELAERRSTKNTTHRRNSSVAYTVTVPKFGVANVSILFPDKTDDEVRSILERSPDFQQLSPWLFIMDPASAEKKEELARRNFDTQRSLLLGLIQRVKVNGELPPVIVKKEPKKYAKTTTRSKVHEAPKPVDGPAHSGPGQYAAPGVEAVTGTVTAFDALGFSDNTPSVKWDKPRLLEYAKARGIKVDDSMPKNTILRKIRGM